jgi:hypothetical protein
MRFEFAARGGGVRDKDAGARGLARSRAALVGASARQASAGSAG